MPVLRPGPLGRSITTVPPRLVAALLAGLVLLALVVPGAAPPARAAGGPCRGSCITGVEVVAGPTAATVLVHTGTPATVRVWLGRSLPRTVAGTLVLDDVLGVRWTYDASTRSTVSFGNLATGHHYYAVVKATGTDGRTHWTYKTFRTWRRTVTVTYHHLHVTNDADSGINRGEFSATLRSNGQAVEVTRRKVASGDTIRIDRTIRTPDAEKFLRLSIGGWEDDGMQNLPDEASGRLDIDLDVPWHQPVRGRLLESMPRGHDGYFMVYTRPAYLEFEAFGYFDVSYAP